MSLIKRPNRLPNNTELTTLNEQIVEEEAILVSITKLRREREKVHVRLLNKSTLLQRTLQSTKVIQDVASQMASSNGPLLEKLKKEIASQEADVSAISACFPSTRDFIKGVKAITSYAALLQTTLERQLQCIGDRVSTVDEELESTVDLDAYTVDAVSSTSTMISMAKDTIKKKRQGLLHPIRRLPTEMLEEIFQVCINEETRGWLDDPSKQPDPPKSATKVASVCRFWRSVALQCPRLWRCLRAPVQSNRPNSYYGHYSIVTTGADHFRNSLRLCGNLAIELTIPRQASIPGDIDITAIPLDRLNLLDVWSQWPPTHCSPLHLWMGQSSSNGSLTREIPSSLLSRTKTITAFSVSITFEAPSRSVNHLIISGRHPTVPFIPLLTSLPNLEELDAKDVQIYQSPAAGSGQTLHHLKLRCIRLHSSCLATLEQSLSDGLRLQVRSLTLSDLTSQNDPLLYPFISTQFSATVTSLGIHGTETTDPTIVRSFIDKFHRLDTLLVSGAAVSSVLRALYDGTGDILRVREMPKGLVTVIIQDYKEDGSALHQNLQMMHSNPATGTQPITIIFEGCPNIKKDIREEFAIAVPMIPMIAIEPPDRDLGPYYDPDGSTQLSDHLLDELDAADGWE